jgi:hypothetical protein
MIMTRTATLRRNFPTLVWLATAPWKWLFGSRRRFLILVSLLGLGITGAGVWWATQLNGLPDIGDPFDVEAFEAQTIPDEQNAFPLYRQAVARLSPLHGQTLDLSPRGMNAKLMDPWSQTKPAYQSLVLDNREALDLFLAGTERPEIGTPPPQRFSNAWHELLSVPLFEFCCLTGLDGSRLEEQGDMAGAWVRYRGLVRLASQLRKHALGVMRGDPDPLDFVIPRVRTWGFDSRTDVKLLRQALDDVLACQERDALSASLLKIQYCFVKSNLELWDGRTHDVGWERLDLMGERYQFPEGPVQAFRNTQKWCEREPERSRRVLRLLFANWLRCAEAPPDQQPRPVLQVVFQERGWSRSYPIYPIDPQTQAQCPAMTPLQLAHWLESSRGAQQFLTRAWSWVQSEHTRLRRLARNGDLILLLASQLFEREHGRTPKSPQELVGTYLPELPDDGSNVLNLGMVPTSKEAAGRPTMPGR